MMPVPILFLACSASGLRVFFGGTMAGSPRCYVWTSLFVEGDQASSPRRAWQWPRQRVSASWRRAIKSPGSRVSVRTTAL